MFGVSVQLKHGRLADGLRFKDTQREFCTKYFHSSSPGVSPSICVLAADYTYLSEKYSLNSNSLVFSNLHMAHLMFVKLQTDVVKFCLMVRATNAVHAALPKRKEQKQTPGETLGHWRDHTACIFGYITEAS